MTYTTTMTTKGQVTIPKPLRDKLGFKPRSKILFVLENDAVKITPAYDIFSLAGTLKPPLGKSLMDARAAMENNYERI